MVYAMLAYFIWIGLVLGVVAFLFRVLRLDRPRQSAAPVRISEERQQ